MFGIPAFLIEPIIGLVVAGIVAAAAYHEWGVFKDHIGAPYTAAQKTIDQPIVTAANQAKAMAELQATNARADTASCVSTAGTQSSALDAANKRAADAQAASRAIIAAANRDAVKNAAEFHRLVAQAAAKPIPNQSCADAQSKTDANLRSTLKGRQVTK